MLLEGDAVGAVGEADYAALGESVIHKTVFHHPVVGMSVDPYVAAAGEAPVETPIQHSSRAAVGGDAMNGAIGIVIQPCALDFTISGLLAGNEGESCNQQPLAVLHHIAHPALHIGKHRIPVRICAAPLKQIARSPHKSLCSSKYFINAVKIT